MISEHSKAERKDHQIEQKHLTAVSLKLVARHNLAFVFYSNMKHYLE